MTQSPTRTKKATRALMKDAPRRHRETAARLMKVPAVAAVAHTRMAPAKAKAGPEKRKRWKLTVMVTTWEPLTRAEVRASVERPLRDFAGFVAPKIKSARVTNADIP